MGSRTMRLLTLLFMCMVYHTQAKVAKIECEGIVVNNTIHEEELLLNINNSPYQLAIDYDTDILFFSFTSQKKDILFESAYLNLKTKEFNIIGNISEGFANAVDFNSHTVYLGGDDGIYTFNYDTKQAQRLEGTRDKIWQLFYKDNLYYTTYPDKYVYVFKNGKSERVPELSNTKALFFAIDIEDNMYFYNSTGLYVHSKVFNTHLYLGDYSLECFTTDKYGNLYFSTDKGIYHLYYKKIEKLASIKHIDGMAVESDGTIIVGFRKTIVRLKSTKKQCIAPEKNLQ